MYMNLPKWTAIFLLFLGIGYSANAQALQINGYNPARHDRFNPGTYAGNPVNNPDFFASQYDWSGVGWDMGMSSRSVTMVSPQHFVCANHWKVPTGNTINFINREGQLKSYTVNKYSSRVIDNVNEFGSHPCDLALGWLSETVSEADKISHYSILDTDDPSSPYYDVNWWGTSLGAQVESNIYLYGQGAQVGRNNEIGSFGYHCPANAYEQTLYASSLFRSEENYNRLGPDPGYPDNAGAVGGDSSSPTFVLWGGELTLFGVHSAVSAVPPMTSWYTYDTFLPRYINDLDMLMEESDYFINRIDVYAVPEPSTILLLGAGLFGVFGLRKKLKE